MEPFGYNPKVACTGHLLCPPSKKEGHIALLLSVGRSTNNFRSFSRSRSIWVQPINLWQIYTPWTSKKSNNSSFRSFSLRGSTYWNEILYIFIIIIPWPSSILGLIDWEYMSIGLWKPLIICSFYSFLRRGLQEKEGDICVSQTSLDVIIVFQNSFPYRTKKINIFVIWHHLNIIT